MWKWDSSPRVNFQCRLLQCLYSPPCSVTCINICVHIKNPQRWQTDHCLDTQKYYTHRLEWVVLLLYLLYLTQVRRPEFPVRDKEILKEKKQKTNKTTTTKKHNHHSKTLTETWLLLSFTLQTSFLHISSGVRCELQE